MSVKGERSIEYGIIVVDGRGTLRVGGATVSPTEVQRLSKRKDWTDETMRDITTEHVVRARVEGSEVDEDEISLSSFEDLVQQLRESDASRI